MTSHTYWNLAATLEWIYYRDEARCVALLPVEDRGDMIIALAQMRAVRQASENINASELLHEALQIGKVVATGRQDGAQRVVIPAMLWCDLEIGGHKVWGNKVLALPKGRTHTPTGLHFENRTPLSTWIDILFERESVMMAFPAAVQETIMEEQPTSIDRVELDDKGRLTKYLKDFYALHAERPTRKDVMAKAQIIGVTPTYARDNYVGICESLGHTRRERGKKPMRIPK